MDVLTRISFLIGLIINIRTAACQEFEVNTWQKGLPIKSNYLKGHLNKSRAKVGNDMLSFINVAGNQNVDSLYLKHATNWTVKQDPQLAPLPHHLTPVHAVRRLVRKRSVKLLDNPHRITSFKFRHHIPPLPHEIRKKQGSKLIRSVTRAKHTSSWKSEPKGLIDHSSNSQESTTPPHKSKSPNITWGRAQAHTAYFDDPNLINVTARDGEQARLPCTVLHLGQAEVLHGDGSLDWTLIIGPVTQRDAGIYECQVSTKPKISRPVNLIVSVEKAEIQGPAEVFIRNGSTISLTCIVKSKSEDLGSVAWMKKGEILDYDSPRGGISLEVEKTPTRSTTKLFITKARKADSGIYICSPQYAQPASVTVHVVNGEESAAVQTNGGEKSPSLSTRSFVTFSFLLYLNSKYFNSFSMQNPAYMILDFHVFLLGCFWGILHLFFSIFIIIIFVTIFLPCLAFDNQFFSLAKLIQKYFNSPQSFTICIHKNKIVEKMLGVYRFTVEYSASIVWPCNKIFKKVIR